MTILRSKYCLTPRLIGETPRSQTCGNEWFQKYFPLLTDGKSPFHWQAQIYELLLDGKCPRHIDLPTGTGKTSFMTAWLLALGWNASAIPRRLVWVVNRRVVVDQATVEAERLAYELERLGPDDELRRVVKGISASNGLLAVSTLSGEREDNQEWKVDPSRAAIVVGTVDMIGSRLLFSGYGDSAYYRPQHAGLLAVDTLLVNDEAHLTRPFAKLVKAVSDRKPAERIAGKQFWFVEMSATHAGEDHEGERFPESLAADCADSEIFEQRFATPKKLYLDSQPDNVRVEARMLGLAVQPGAARTIVYIEQPEKAREMSARLARQFPGRVKLLTGTMRGKERDSLSFKDFAESPPGERVFLVATSAGEVGIDITSERVITGIATIEHLIQRFGRLDRYGKGAGEAYVVYTEATLRYKPFQTTLDYLQTLTPEFSSKILRERPPPSEAREEAIKTAELQDWLIDLWSQTSDPVRSYPKVEPWLHGKQEDSEDTELAWREDVVLLAAETVSSEDRKAVFQLFPVLARERLREPTRELKRKLAEIAGQYPRTRVLVRERDGSVWAGTLRETVEKDLSYTLVLLPPGCGGLEAGMLSSAKSADWGSDEADGFSPGDKMRRRYLSEDDQKRALVDREELPNLVNGRERLKIILSTEEEGPEIVLFYMQEKPEQKQQTELLLDAHLRNVEKKARLLAEKLVPDLVEIYAMAGLKHDCGKERDLWQRYMGRCAGKIVAKSFQAPFPKGMCGYRHELGSMLDAAEAPELVLHLIASHHGHARPHFEAKAADAKYLKRSRESMNEAPLRFARLTEQYGPWGLAYLEALLKAADAWASDEGPEDND